MSMQLQSTSTVLSISLEKTEVLTAIKNEPPESEIGIDDIPNSLDEEIIPDIKDIDIVSHILSEDLIKSETVSENMFENNHSGSVKTQVCVKTENIPLIKTENITQSEYLYKTQDIIDGIVSRGCSQGVIRNRKAEVDGRYLKYHCDKCKFKTCWSSNFKRHILIHLKPEQIPYFYCYHCPYKCKEKSSLKRHIFNHFKKEEVPFHCYICDFTTLKRNLIIEHFKKHPKHHSKCDETDYKNQLETYTKKQMRIAKYSVSIKNMSMQSQSTSPVLSVSLTAINNEPLESEIGIVDIPNSLDEEIIPDIKEIDIVSHELSEDLIKSETVSENTFENNYSGSVETQVFVKTENIPLIKTENIIQNEYLYKTQDTSDGNVSRGTSQVVIKAQVSNEHFSALQSDKQSVNFFKDLSDISRKAKCPNKTDFYECYKTIENTSCEKDIKKGKVIQVPVIPIEPHKYTSLVKAKRACNKNKSTHEQNKKRYCCEECTYISERSSDVKRHQLTHKTKAEMDDRLLKYRCDKCKFKTYRSNSLKRHKLLHLKPEEIHYFYCYHCSYKSKQKNALKTHIFRHFKNEDVPFHCYICDFTTLKSNLIIEHFKKHPKHHSKCDETDYKNQRETYTKKLMRYNYCKKCSFKTYHYERLKLHELTHKTEAKMDDRHFKHIHIFFNILYCCEKCTYTSEKSSDFKRHQLTHTTKAEIDDQLLKYRCDKCKYETSWPTNFKIHKLKHLKPEQIPYLYCCHCPYKCKQKSNLKTHIFKHFKNEEVSFHCYICDFTTLKRNLIIEHFKKHPKHHSKCDEADYKNQLETYTMRYCCEKCTYTSGSSSNFKRHQLTHKIKAEIDDRLLKFRCDKCKYKTCWSNNLKVHKLIHLKPEQVLYFYCYHCSYKCKRKDNLKIHISNHFKREEIPFQCHICNFVTLKRDLIIEHFKKHPKHHSKCDETDY